MRVKKKKELLTSLESTISVSLRACFTLPCDGYNLASVFDVFPEKITAVLQGS
jgi:hypothetical protein